MPSQGVDTTNRVFGVLSLPRLLSDAHAMSDPHLSDWEEKLQDYIDNLPPMTRKEVRAELWSYLMTVRKRLAGDPVGEK